MMMQKFYNSVLTIMLFLMCVVGIKILWDQPETRAEFKNTLNAIVEVIID